MTWDGSGAWRSRQRSRRSSLRRCGARCSSALRGGEPLEASGGACGAHCSGAGQKKGGAASCVRPTSPARLFLLCVVCFSGRRGTHILHAPPRGKRCFDRRAPPWPSAGPSLQCVPHVPPRLRLAGEAGQASRAPGDFLFSPAVRGCADTLCTTFRPAPVHPGSPDGPLGAQGHSQGLGAAIRASTNCARRPGAPRRPSPSTATASPSPFW